MESQQGDQRPQQHPSSARLATPRTPRGENSQPGTPRGEHPHPHTPQAYHWTRHQRPYSTHPRRTHDNSEGDQSGAGLNSCTDQVANERRTFGPWIKPDSARQKQLVDRLAPYKPPAQPDPRFDHWVNHFQYYWDIGVEAPPRRRRVQHPEGGGGAGDGSDGYRDNTNYNNSGGGSGGQDGGLFKGQYHRVLKRPRTTHGRLPSGSSGSEHNMSSESSSGGDVSPPARRTMHGEAWPSRGTQSARPGYGSGGSGSSMMPGLDRRYMGLQSVNSDQLTEIVSRLTRMTSAYNAKFAPNPHVWVDDAPGAHAVVKRENTIA